MGLALTITETGAQKAPSSPKLEVANHPGELKTGRYPLRNAHLGCGFGSPAGFCAVLKPGGLDPLDASAGREGQPEKAREQPIFIYCGRLQSVVSSPLPPLPLFFLYFVPLALLRRRHPNCHPVPANNSRALR